MRPFMDILSNCATSYAVLKDGCDCVHYIVYTVIDEYMCHITIGGVLFL